MLAFLDGKGETHTVPVKAHEHPRRQQDGVSAVTVEINSSVPAQSRLLRNRLFNATRFPHAVVGVNLQVLSMEWPDNRIRIRGAPRYRSNR